MLFTQTAVALESNFLPTPSIFSAIKKLNSLLTRDEKWKCIGIIGFAICTSLLEVITAYVIVVFAQVLNEPELGYKYLHKMGLNEHVPQWRVILNISILCGVVFFIKNFVAAIEVFYQNFSIQKMNFNFKNKLLVKYAKSDYSFYLTRNSSLGVAVVGGDAELMFSSGMISIASVLSESVVFLFLVGMVIIMNPSLALIIFVIGGILGFAISKSLLPLFYRWGQDLQDAVLHSGQNLLQFFHAFKEIVLLGKRETFIGAYQFYSYKKSQILAKQTATNSLPRIMIEILFVGLFVITVSYMCLKNESPTQMIGILGGYLYAGFRLMPGLNRIIGQLNLFKSVTPSIERVHHEYYREALNENYTNIPAFQFKKSITLKNVSFSYLNKKNDVLKNIDLEIKKGECVGIVGETGSGKSTLVDIILGLLKPRQGSIVIDDVYPVNSYQWHRLIGYVPQSVYLTDDTISSNIAFGVKPQEINHLRLNQAIEAAQLSRFIARLPNGINTLVGERGIRLSGGERQRISIARALYHNPDVLIFDEATSALDNETESLLMETIHNLTQNRTVIMIAHRLTTLKDCNRIIVMEEGSVKHVTSYKKLLATKMTHYA